MRIVARFASALAAGVFGVLLCAGFGPALPAAYAQMPAYGGMPAFCSVNHAERGAAIGARIGAARWGARGAQIGAEIGAARGARIDALCRQIAYREALQMAMAAPPPAAVPPTSAEAQPPAAAGSGGAYASVEYVTPSNQERHQITPLKAYTDPATHERCMVSTEVSFSQSGQQGPPVTGRVCEGADGQLHEM